MKNSAVIETIDYFRIRPLYLAIYHGHIIIVRILFKKKTIKEVVDIGKSTPLIIVARQDYHKVVRI